MEESTSLSANPIFLGQSVAAEGMTWYRNTAQGTLLSQIELVISHGRPAASLAKMWD